MNRRRMKGARPGWAHLLVPVAPAIIWIGYFMVVYLYAEAGCALGWAQPSWFGLHGVAVVTSLATLPALIIIAYYTVRSWRAYVGGGNGDRDDQHASRSLGLLGVLSGIIFLVATVSVGLPALLVAAC